CVVRGPSGVAAGGSRHVPAHGDLGRDQQPLSHPGVPRGLLAASMSELEPPYLYPDYVGTRLRAPAKPLVNLPEGFHDFPAPLFPRTITELDHDLTRQHAGEPIGERIIVTG